MGGGSYSQNSRSVRAVAQGYATKSVEQTFSQRSIHPKMSPSGATLRESCDSTEHPKSLAIILALDVTGSMGYVPGQLVKDGLPEMVKLITEAGIPDPQVLFLGVGDHFCDRAPLQVGQFETSDELLDFWLTNVWLESGGGGNGGESYGLAHYFAGHHTAIDCFKNRGQKGFLFTIGDENNHRSYSGRDISALMGIKESATFSASQLIEKAEETYHVYHIHLGSSHDSEAGTWKALLGERLICTRDHREIPGIIAKIVGNYTSNDSKVEEKETISSVKPILSDDTTGDSQIML